MRGKNYPQIYRLFELSIRSIGLPSPVSEYRFAPPRLWRVDYAWIEPDIRLMLEVEGGAWIQGRHNRAKSFLSDMEKYNELAIQRYYLLRVTPQQVENGEALMILERWFKGEK